MFKRLRSHAREERNAKLEKIVLRDDFDGVRSHLEVDDKGRMSRTSREWRDNKERCLPTDSKFSTSFDRATHSPDPCPVYLTPENFDGTPIPNSDGVRDGCCIADSNELFLQALYFSYSRVEIPGALGRATMRSLETWIRGKIRNGPPTQGVTVPSPFLGGLGLQLDPTLPWYILFIKFLCLATPQFELDELNANGMYRRLRPSMLTPLGVTWFVRHGVDNAIIAGMDEVGVRSPVFYELPPPVPPNSVLVIEPRKFAKVIYRKWTFVDLDHLLDRLENAQNLWDPFGVSGSFDVNAIATGMFQMHQSFHDICLRIFNAIRHATTGEGRLRVEWSNTTQVAPAARSLFPVVTTQTMDGIVANMITYVTTNLTGNWVSNFLPAQPNLLARYEITQGNNNNPMFVCNYWEDFIEFRFVL